MFLSFWYFDEKFFKEMLFLDGPGLVESPTGTILSFGQGLQGWDCDAQRFSFSFRFDRKSVLSSQNQVIQRIYSERDAPAPRGSGHCLGGRL